MNTIHILKAKAKNRAKAWSIADIIRFQRRAVVADRIWLVIKLAAIVFGLIGSVWGILRIRQLRAEGEALDAAIAWLDLGNRIKIEAIRAHSDENHPTRGLIAVAEALYDDFNHQIGGSL